MHPPSPLRAGADAVRLGSRGLPGNHVAHRWRPRLSGDRPMKGRSCSTRWSSRSLCSTPPVLPASNCSNLNSSSCCSAFQGRPRVGGSLSPRTDTSSRSYSPISWDLSLGTMVGCMRRGGIDAREKGPGVELGCLDEASPEQPRRSICGWRVLFPRRPADGPPGRVLRGHVDRRTARR
jgi:hypothetical protein